MFATRGRAVVGVALCLSCEASAPPARPPVPAPLVPPIVSAPPPVPVPVDTTGWARASDSAFAAGMRFHDVVKPSCLSDAGCVAPANIPTCPALPDAESEQTLYQNFHELKGKRAVVRGDLSGYDSFTGWDCRGMGCCNRGDAHLEIGQTLRLVDRERAEAFRCGGDDSIVCCGFELVDDVIVSGVVKGTADYAEIEDVALCAVRSAADAPPEASFEEEGCVVDGTLRKWNETFAHGDRRCACYGGRIYCRRDGCFHAGRWYARGSSRPLGDSCSHCSCEDDWKCERHGCWAERTSFSSGDVGLDTHDREELRKLATRFAERPRVEIEVRGYASADEGKRAMSLSRKRADAVARELVRGGVPRSWIVIRALGVSDDRHNVPQASVELHVRDYELPQRDPPRPP